MREDLVSLGARALGAEAPRGQRWRPRGELRRHRAVALTGRLLVMHGLMDENVHFANTAKLVDALVAAQKPFDLFVFPGERHGTRAPAAKEWSSRKVAEFFVETLR